MATIPEALDNEHFAEYLDLISMLYFTDADFTNLCDDYCVIKRKIENIKGRTSRDRKIALEYKLLALDLEKEILEYAERRMKL